jgi:hypothetical protein
MRPTSPTVRLRRDDRRGHTLFEWMGVAGLVATAVRFAADIRGHRLRQRLAAREDVPATKLPKNPQEGQEGQEARKKAAKVQPLAH